MRSILFCFTYINFYFALLTTVLISVQVHFRDFFSLCFLHQEILKQKSGPDFSVETTHLYPQSSALVSAFRLPLSSTNCFVCNFFSSSVGFNLCSCFFRLTLVFRFRFRRLWAVQLAAFAASFPLSDPRCFGFLSSASVLGSDYSASAFPFLLFPVPPRSCFPGARFRSRFLGFPFLSDLISHAFLPGSCTWLRCSFLFALPCFAPTAVPQVLAFCFRFRHFLLPVRFLSSAFLPLPATQPSVSSFPLFPASPHSGFSGAPFRLSASRLFHFCFARFPALPFRFSYSASCLFPFILPGFAPTAVPPVLPFCFRFRAFPSLPLSFVRFRSVLTTQPSALSFPFFPLSPVGGSRGAFFLFRPACFHAFLPIPVLGLLQFLSPFAGSLHSSYPCASAFFLSVSGRSSWLSL